MKIKNLLSNKKTLLSLIAGVTITLGAIAAGTYAWFTSNAEVDGAEFTTATVALDEVDGGYGVYNFVTGIQQNIPMQKSLEAGDADIFAGWLMAVNPDTQLMKGNYYDSKAQVESLIEQFKIVLYPAFLVAQEEHQNAVATLEAAEDAVLAIKSEMPIYPKEPFYMDYYDFEAFAEALLTWDFVSPMPIITDYYDEALGEAAWAEWQIKYDAYEIEYAIWYGALSDAELEQLAAKADLDALRVAVREARSTAMEVRREARALSRYLSNTAVFELAPNNRVTPGAFIYGSFAITNDSNVDTYFRLKAPVFNDDNVGIIKAVAINGLTEYELELYNDGYYYSPAVLAEDADITIVIGVYIYGNANDNEVQTKDFNLSQGTVELIQASNNAAFLSDWAPEYDFYNN